MDLWRLYQLRCQQIRNAYDYCVIFYSGGSDSDNILRAWISAGCKLDEIATIKIPADQSANGVFDWAVEVPQVVEPTIKLLQSQGLAFRYREINSVIHTIDYLTRNINDYFYHASQSFSPNNTMKSRLRDSVRDYQVMIDKGCRLCFIWGSDKPQIRYDATQDQWFFDFVDIVDNCVSPDVQERYDQGWYDELFYWTPDMPEIVVKQAHVLKRWCTTQHDPQFYQPTAGPYGYNKRLKAWLTAASVKLAVYPRWNPATLVAPKPRFGSVRPDRGYMVYSERDAWLFGTEGDLQRRYDDQVKSVTAYLHAHSRWNWAADPQSGNQTLWTNSRQSHRFA